MVPEPPRNTINAPNKEKYTWDHNCQDMEFGGGGGAGGGVFQQGTVEWVLIKSELQIHFLTCHIPPRLYWHLRIKHRLAGSQRYVSWTWCSERVLAWTSPPSPPQEAVPRAGSRARRRLLEDGGLTQPGPEAHGRQAQEEAVGGRGAEGAPNTAEVRRGWKSQGLSTEHHCHLTKWWQVNYGYSDAFSEVSEMSLFPQGRQVEVLVANDETWALKWSLEFWKT